MILTSPKNKHARQYVERKLKIRLRVFFMVWLLLMAVIIYEISIRYLSLEKGFVAYLSGIIIGALFTRRKKIFWEEETSLVIARMDRLGIILLAIYVPYVLLRHVFLSRLFYGHELTAFSFALASGSMTGRILSMRTQIRRVLRHQKIL